MLEQFKPTWMLEAIYQLTPAQLEKHQIKAILTDLDNTLIAWNNPDGTKELLEWLAVMEAAGIPVLVISNNNEARVKRAVEPFGLDFISRAMKPFTRGMHQAVAQLDLPKEAIVMVGDQVMTDIKASNTAGIRSILVKPVVSTDAWNTKFNRWLESKVMAHLHKKNPDMKWKSELV